MAKSIWPKASPRRVARSLEAHSVIALALGGLIYILAITGTLSVFNHDFQRWEQPAAPETSVISLEAAAKAAQAVFESEVEPTKHLYINFPQPDLPRTVITTDTQAFFASATGEIAGEESFPWTQFLLDLHYYLHLPHILGVTIVGALGAFLIAMSISGFLSHPRIFRDAFTFRRGAGRLTTADLHNRLSVWTAPFHISNALTGAILGLASVLAFAIAATSFDGDTGKVFDPVFGGEPPANETAAAMADMVGPIQHVQTQFPEVNLTYYILHDPGTVGQRSQLIAEHSNRLIFGEYYNYDGAGVYQGNTGMSDGTAGQQIIGSVYNVHFGNWGGVPVKLAYLLFGLSLCIVSASGLNIYFAKRREKGRPAPKLESGWAGIVWGTPLALTVTMIAAFGLGGESWILVAVFWCGLVGIVVGATLKSSAAATRSRLQVTTSIALVFAVILQSISAPSAMLSAASVPVSLALLAVAAVLVTLNVHHSSTVDLVPPKSD